MADKHDTIRVRNLEDFEDYPIATGDYLVVATSDPDQKKQTLKATIADVVSIYLDKIEEDSAGAGPPTRNVDLPPSEDGTDGGSYELDNRDITVANLEEIAGFGIKVEEHCLGKDNNGVYYSVPCTIPSSTNPDVQVHNPEVSFKTKKLAVNAEEASTQLEIQTIGLTDVLLDYITDYEYDETNNQFKRIELARHGIKFEAGVAKSLDYYMGMFLQYASPVESFSGWWQITASESYPNFTFGPFLFLESNVTSAPIGQWMFKAAPGFWKYLGGVSPGSVDGGPGFWMWESTLGWHWFQPKSYPWMWLDSPWKDRDHIGWVYFHHIDGAEQDKFFISDSNAPIEELNDDRYGPYSKWATRSDDPFNTENNSDGDPGTIGDQNGVLDDNPSESPDEDPEPI